MRFKLKTRSFARSVAGGPPDGSRNDTGRNAFSDWFAKQSQDTDPFAHLKSVVFVPEARVAWTGNLIVGQGSIPFLIEGGAGEYLETMAKFTHTLEVTTIIPGHRLLSSGAIFGRYLPYLSELMESVRKAVRVGQNLEEAKPPLRSGSNTCRTSWASLHGCGLINDRELLFNE